jgi:hypothetical protein
MPGPATQPGHGQTQMPPLGLVQAGPRLPVPILPIGPQTAVRYTPGTAIEDERESSRLLPGAPCLPGAATTVRLRIG